MMQILVASVSKVAEVTVTETVTVMLALTVTVQYAMHIIIPLVS